MNNEAPDAHGIVKALRGRWSGHGGVCQCPAHEDRTPSLSVTSAQDGRVLVHCFTGCSQRSVLEALRARGLWPDGVDSWVKPAPSARPTIDRETEKKREHAKRIWREALPIANTPAETYLRARGITDPLPPTLRFARLKHAPDNFKVKPALVCAIQGADGKVTSVQRIFLREDGSGKTDAQPAKLTCGPMENGALRLGPAGTVIGIAEGPETALSAMQLFGMTVWCSLGALRMPKVIFPDTVEQVHIFADSGPVGAEEASNAMETYQGRGLSVAIRPPETGDWNDVLRGEA